MNHKQITFVPMPTRPDFQDLTGRTFNRLTVLGYAGKGRWFCRCACGEIRTPQSGAIKNGSIKSCGCLVVDIQRQRHLTHGLSDSPTYDAWKGIKRRCYNPNFSKYHRYGGRGIQMCERWRESFEAFVSDMGERPSPNHSIERENNDGHYSPENCKWAVKIEQNNNKSTNRMLTFKGKTQSLTMWSRELHINASTIQNRLACGWSVCDTLTKPIRLNRRWHS